MGRRRPYSESLGQLEGGAIRRGAAEVPALGSTTGEEVRGSTALVFAIALGYMTGQTHRLPRSPFRWLTAHHRDDPLLLGILQDLGWPWTGPFVQASLQAAALPVAMGDLANRVRRSAIGTQVGNCPI